MFDFYVSARCPLLYSITRLGCRVFCSGDYHVSVNYLDFGLFRYVCALSFVTFDIYVSARCLVFCSIVTLRCAVLCLSLLCLIGDVSARGLLLCLVSYVCAFLSGILFDVYVSSRCGLLRLIVTLVLAVLC